MIKREQPVASSFDFFEPGKSHQSSDPKKKRIDENVPIVRPNYKMALKAGQ